ncbi:MAG: phosphohydrolase, partial [Candidatus Sericytochromatia bacterium]|nr:phosphohydrolase [Candidatus Tanganyikabacteria bacterium]
ADTYEALTHRRPYRVALDPQDALAELQRLAGIHFDPELVALFVREVYPTILAQREPLPIA